VSAARGLVLDAGAFIAAERRDERMVALVAALHKARIPLVTSAGVVGQVFRGGTGRQVPVSFLLRQTTVVDLTYAVARVLGRMLGSTKTSDVIDAHIVLLARERDWTVLTSDPDDLRRIDSGLTIETI
jgi:predicted nucleic acid-binding protein